MGGTVGKVVDLKSKIANKGLHAERGEDKDYDELHAFRPAEPMLFYIVADPNIK